MNSKYKKLIQNLLIMTFVTTFTWYFMLITSANLIIMIISNNYYHFNNLNYIVFQQLIFVYNSKYFLRKKALFFITKIVPFSLHMEDFNLCT